MKPETAGNAPERELRSRISLKYGSGKGVLLSAPEVKTLYKLLGLPLKKQRRKLRKIKKYMEYSIERGNLQKE